MTPEEPEAKATVQLLYRAIGELRTEMFAQLGDLDTRMEARFASVLDAVEALRGCVVAEPVCHERHAAVDAAIASAVEKSQADRNKLWDAVHDVQSQLKWAAGIVIVAFLGIVGYLIQSHL